MRTSSLAGLGANARRPDREFNLDVMECAGRFSAALQMTTAADVANLMDEAIELFQRLRRNYMRQFLFSPCQCEALLSSLASARLAISLYMDGEARIALIGAARAIQALVVHFGHLSGAQRLPDDRFLDMVDCMRLGQNIARNIVLIDSLARREAGRCSPLNERDAS